jgi:hypothetical protein
MRKLLHALGAVVLVMVLAVIAGAQADTRTYQDALDFGAPLVARADASYNWSGYVAEGGYYTTVSGTWTVPEVQDTDMVLGADAAWVGIGGVETDDLIQAGTQTIVQNGEVYYEAWYEKLPAASVPVPLRVRPGDTVTVSVAESRPGYWHISFVNHTTGRSHSFTTRYHSSHSSAEWVQEMPSLAAHRGGGFIPLTDFGSIVFTGARAVADGVSMTPEEAGAKPLAMFSLEGDALALPSVLGVDGASFSVVRTDAAVIATRERRESQPTFLLPSL